MTSFIVWIALAAGALPGTGLSSEDFDKYFVEAERARNQCGPTAVCYCLGRMGREVPLEELNRQVEIGVDGASLQSLLDLLHHYNVPARGLHAEPLDVRLLPRPCILIIDRQHCVVLERLEPSGEEATIFEPARRAFVTLPIAELTRQCSGEVIVFAEPGVKLSGFLAWMLCSLTVFLCLGIGAARIGRWLTVRGFHRKCEAAATNASAGRPSDEPIPGGEQSRVQSQEEPAER